MSAIPDSAPNPPESKKRRKKDGSTASCLSTEVQALLKKADGAPMTFGAIIDSFPSRSHAMLLAFLSFPLCLPVGIPVLSTLLGQAVALVALFLLFGKAPWLPRRLRARSVPYERLETAVHKLLRTLNRFEHWLHPRLPVLSENPHLIRIHAFTILLLGILASLPILFLFANFVAAFPVFLIALGLLERDGYFIVAGYAFVPVTLAYYIGLIFLGVEGVQKMIGL